MARGVQTLRERFERPLLVLLGVVGVLLLIACCNNGGAVVGIPAALAASSLVRSLLFDVTPTDAATVAGATLTLIATALLAPRRRRVGRPRSIPWSPCAASEEIDRVTRYGVMGLTLIVLARCAQSERGYGFSATRHAERPCVNAYRRIVPVAFKPSASVTTLA